MDEAGDDRSIPVFRRYHHIYNQGFLYIEQDTVTHTMNKPVSDPRSTIGADKPILAVLSGQRIGPPPIWLMRQAGRYLPEYRALRSRADRFLDLCFSPRLAVEITLQPVRRFGVDAAILFSDILVLPHAMGQLVEFVAGEGPRLDPLIDGVAVAALDTGPAASRRWQPVLETVSGVKAALPAGVTLIGFAGAPWTVAAYMVEGGGSRDFLTARRFARMQPVAFRSLIDRLVSVTADYLTEQVDAGAEVLQIFDSWAGLLPEDAFADWVIEPTRTLVAALRQRRPGVPIIGFPRGAGWLHARYVRETGVDAVSLDTTVPMAQARELQSAVPVQGNLDPVLVVAGGDELTRRARRLVADLASGPHIVNLGHGVPQETPPEHVAALIEAVRSAPGREA